MLTINLCQQLKLTEDQLRILRATFNGSPKGDEDLLEEKVEAVMKIADLDYFQAEKRLKANVVHELNMLNSDRENHWMQKVNSGDVVAIHDTSGTE